MHIKPYEIKETPEFKGDMGAPVSEVKFLDEDSGTFEGYASIFNEVDNGRDVVVPGAFAESLTKRPAKTIKMLWQHRSDKPIGKWDEIAEDGRGLRVKGRLFTGLQQGRECYELMKEGVLDSLSIGYRTLDDKVELVNGHRVRQLLKMDLREISIVTFPMLESAKISGIKSIQLAIDELTNLSDAERLLREAGRPFSKKEATDFVSVVKKIARREAGDDLKGGDDIAALNRLADLLRS